MSRDLLSMPAFRIHVFRACEWLSFFRGSSSFLSRTVGREIVGDEDDLGISFVSLLFFDDFVS